MAAMHNYSGGGGPSDERDRLSKTDKQVEYIRMLEERNRLKKALAAKSKKESATEQRERGFNLNFAGANDGSAAKDERGHTAAVSVIGGRGASPGAAVRTSPRPPTSAASPRAGGSAGAQTGKTAKSNLAGKSKAAAADGKGKVKGKGWAARASYDIVGESGKKVKVTRKKKASALAAPPSAAAQTEAASAAVAAAVAAAEAAIANIDAAKPAATATPAASTVDAAEQALSDGEDGYSDDAFDENENNREGEPSTRRPAQPSTSTLIVSFIPNPPPLPRHRCRRLLLGRV